MNEAQLKDALKLFRRIDPSIASGAMLTFLTVAKYRDAIARDIQSELEVTATSAAHNIQFWESRGYVTREPDPNDARAMRLVLTPKGQELYQRLRNT